MTNIPLIEPGEAEERLRAELERFSFGIAVSPLVDVVPLAGPDNFVQTTASLGGISINHAQHPGGQQNIRATGERVPEQVAGHNFLFDTHAGLLMAWIEGNAGPIPVPPDVTSKLANTVKALNDNYDNQA